MLNGFLWGSDTVKSLINCTTLLDARTSDVIGTILSTQSILIKAMCFVFFIAQILPQLYLVCTGLRKHTHFSVFVLYYAINDSKFTNRTRFDDVGCSGEDERGGTVRSLAGVCWIFECCCRLLVDRILARVPFGHHAFLLEPCKLALVVDGGEHLPQQ